MSASTDGPAMASWHASVESMTYDLNVLGYLAPLQRLKLSVPRDGVGSGQRGERLPPTLTCDAPLVGLACAEASLRVHGLFNHPGRGGHGRAIEGLCQHAGLQCAFGPDSGELLEWQLLHADGEVTWFNAPENGLASLCALAWRMPPARMLYLDAYPWLDQVLSSLGETRHEHLWINFGVLVPAEIAPRVRHWRQRSAGCLHVQISQAHACSQHALEAAARQAVEAGADQAVVTGGQLGLVLARPHELVRQAALPVNGFRDASGAGAAVAAELIGCVLREEALGPAELAHRAALAGQAQCEVDGALNARHTAVWHQLVNHHDHLAHLPA